MLDTKKNCETKNITLKKSQTELNNKQKRPNFTILQS